MDYFASFPDIFGLATYNFKTFQISKGAVPVRKIDRPFKLLGDIAIR